jgi:hypothetical protein
VSQATIVRIIPYMDGQQAVVLVSTEAQTRLSFFVDGKLVPISWSDGYEVRGGFVVFKKALDCESVLFRILVPHPGTGSVRYQCKLDELDVVDQVAGLADQLGLEENLTHGGKPSGRAEAGGPA